MKNPNLTMEEYIRLEEEKAHKRGKVFNWQTAKYGKIRVDDDFYDLRSMEAEFPAIVVNNDFAPKDTLQCKSQVSIPVNDEIDFRISFDESDDEDYTIICDKNSFSYKMISVNNLKTDSKNDYEKVMPSIPSSEPALSCFDDLDFFKDFENEFPAIVYNDAQTSKSNLLTELIFNPQHINEFDLSDETSLSEYDEEEQNIFTNLCAPFGVPFDPKRDHKDGDCAIMLRRPSTDGLNFYTLVLSSLILQIWLFHHVSSDTDFLVERYTGYRLWIFRELLRDGLFATMAMEHRDEAEVLLDLDAPGTIQFQLGGARRRLSWRQFILVLGLHIGEEMESLGFARDPVLRLCHRMMVRNIAGRSQAPEKVTVTDLFYLRGMDVGSHFGLLTAKILGGLTVVAPEPQMIDMAALVRLQIYVQLDDTWDWVAMGPERQQDTTAGALAIAEDALAIDEGDQAVSAPGLCRDVGSFCGLVERSITDQGRFFTWMMTCMTQLMDASGLTYHAFDGTFQGSSPLAF
ncbi:hypothetical protein Tco_1005992 [Tanacetum coccineum]|uniref:Uncharacterized protein n=1 Tax=Tanacetum coccineum TaxID=301880 RepID=A0ABQ5FH06_9ASTR